MFSSYSNEGTHRRRRPKKAYQPPHTHSIEAPALLEMAEHHPANPLVLVPGLKQKRLAASGVRTMFFLLEHAS